MLLKARKSRLQAVVLQQRYSAEPTSYCRPSFSNTWQVKQHPIRKALQHITHCRAKG